MTHKEVLEKKEQLLNKLKEHQSEIQKEHTLKELQKLELLEKSFGVKLDRMIKTNKNSKIIKKNER